MAGLVLFTLVLILGTIVKFLPKTVGRKIVTKTESNLDDTLRIQIYEAFNKAKIEIALPQQIVHVRERKR